MAMRAERRGGRRLRRWAAGGIVAAAALLAWVTCVPPASFRAVKQPREGRAVGRRVAVVYSKHYQINLAGLERLHPFDIHKYARIYLHLQTDGLLRPEDVFVPRPVGDEQVLLVHTPAFLRSLKDPKAVARYLEAPAVRFAPAVAVEAGVVSAFRCATGGTVLAGRLALKHGIAINLAGGYHHAKPDAGEGFCLFNDLGVAIRVLQREGLIRRAAVVDLDVHQGNGTAAIFAGDEDVFTFSMHEGGIYPFPKAKSDLDVELPAGTDDEAYLRRLRRHLPGVLLAALPDIVFLQAGCDTLAGDPLAHLKMTPGGIVRRDALVIDACVRRGIPIVMTLGGGYSRGAWRAQHASIKRTIRKHGLAGGQSPHPRRQPSLKEKVYTK